MVSFLYAASFVCGVLSFAQQHPGAYSSPHYAKKNLHYSQTYNHPSAYKEPEYQKLASVDRFDKANPERSKHQDIDLEDSYERLPNQDVPQNVDSNDLEVYGGNETQSGRSSGLMASAGNFLSGRGGQMLADIAREIIARSTGATSQVGGEVIRQVCQLHLARVCGHLPYDQLAPCIGFNFTQCCF